MDNKANGNLAAPRFWLAALVVLAAAASRLLPHPLNFTPVGAMALFAGAHFAKRIHAFLLPVIAMVLSDLAMEALFRAGLYPRPGFHGTMPAIYASFVAAVGIGVFLRKRRRPLPIALGALASSCLFFLYTNYAHWLAFRSYPMTAAGLLECYVAALPFFRHTLAGDLFYTAVLFGGFALAERLVPRLTTVPTPTT